MRHTIKLWQDRAGSDVDRPVCCANWNSDWRDAPAEQAELVSFRVRENVPALLAGLPDVHRGRAGGKQPRKLAVLLSVVGCGPPKPTSAGPISTLSPTRSSTT
jgi:hypothetical protein